MKVTNHLISHKLDNLVQILSTRAEYSPNDVLYQFYNHELHSESLTYLELHRKAIAIAMMISEKSKVGDRVLIISSPGLALIIAFFGCLYARRIAVIAQPPTHNALREKLLKITQNTQPSVIITSSSETNEFLQQQPFNQLNIIGINIKDTELQERKSTVTHLEDCTFDEPKTWNPESIYPDDIAFLQYSSGSTGNPKGIVLTHSNLMHNCALMAEGFHFERIENYVSWVPPYHDMGLIGAILSPLYGGFTSHLLTPMTFLRSPFTWLKLISMHPNVLSGAPDFAYQFCIQKIQQEQLHSLNLNGWQVAYIGAEPVKIETLHNFYEKFKYAGFKKESLFPGYGLAEATLAVSINDNPLIPWSVRVLKEDLKKNELSFAQEESAHTTTLVNCGRPLQPVIIVDSNTLEQVSENHIGEIWISSGPNIAKGYWGVEDKLQSAFKAQLTNDHGTNYLRTGDLGFLHNGGLFVTGRIKDLIIIHGENHHPHDIEHTIKLATTRTEVLNCVALSMPIDGQEGLTILCETKDNKDEKTYNQLVNKLLEEISFQHNLTTQSIVFVPRHSILITTSGKLKRAQCKEMLENGEYKILHQFIMPKNNPVSHKISNISQNNEEEVLQWITEWIRTKYNLNTEAITSNDPFVKFGLDSVNIIELVQAIEKNFDITLLAARAIDYPTPKKLANYLINNYPLNSFTQSNSSNPPLVTEKLNLSSSNEQTLRGKEQQSEESQNINHGQLMTNKTMLQEETQHAPLEQVTPQQAANQEETQHTPFEQVTPQQAAHQDKIQHTPFEQVTPQQAAHQDEIQHAPFEQKTRPSSEVEITPISYSTLIEPKQNEALKIDLVFNTIKQLRKDKLVGLTVTQVENRPNYFIFNELQSNPMLAFFSCSYLGLEWHHLLKEKVIDAEQSIGSQLSSSRGYVSIDSYTELTQLLTQIYNIEPVIASTTTLGHLSTLPILIQENDVIILDEQVHNSLQITAKICLANGTLVTRINHNDMNALENKILELAPLKKNRIWYLADGLYSMHGDFAPMPKLLALMHKYPSLHSYIDDAHSFGWLGEHGCGYVAQFSNDPAFDRVVLIGSMAKAFAACGGVILTKNEDWRERISLCGGPQIFSGPIQPPILAAAIGSATIMLSDEFPALQEQLTSNIHYFRNLLIDAGLNSVSSGEAPIFFLQIGDLKQVTSLCHYLHTKNYYVPPTGFPAVQHNQAGLRVTLNRLHKFSELDGLVESILKWQLNY